MVWLCNSSLSCLFPVLFSRLNRQKTRGALASLLSGVSQEGGRSLNKGPLHIKKNGGLCWAAMVSCSSLSLCCHFCFLNTHSRQLLPDPVTGSLRTLLYWVCIFKKILISYLLFCGVRPRSVRVFLPLSLTLTVLPLPALNKDNYSGNISANQTGPCILPVRGATSQDLANIAGAWSPCLKSGAFPRLRSESVLHVL